MSTNFYAIKLIAASEHAEIERALVQRQYEQVKELINRYQRSYHIGKRSIGWQFLFCANDPNLAPWSPTRVSLDEFLHRPDVTIKDEYGVVFSPEDFWKEIEDCLYHDEKHINGEDYDKLEPNKYYKLTDTEFTTDEGLRWSTNADFS